MKLKDFLKQFEGLDPETEIYQASNEDDDGERILHSQFELKNISVVDCPYYKDTLMIPNGCFYINYNENSKNVWVIL